MVSCVTGVRCSRVVVIVTSKAGEQQAITYNNRLIIKGLTQALQVSRTMVHRV